MHMPLGGGRRNGPVRLNGKMGVVKELKEDSVSVLFNGMEIITTGGGAMFSTYSSRRKKDVASRLQIPLRLSYAITVHKAQGLIMDRVFVDCRHMTKPGQIAFAVGRTTCKKGLTVINPKPGEVPPQWSELEEFYDGPSNCLAGINQARKQMMKTSVNQSSIGFPFTL